MFGTGLKSGAVAVATIESGSASVAIMRTGEPLELLGYAREELPLEERSKGALRSGVVSALADACEKALAAASRSGAPRVGSCYCVIGAPWTRSFSGSAHAQLERSAAITDAMIGSLAKQALAQQKDVEPANMLEGSVTRVLLNGYRAPEPIGKRAQTITIFTLISDCDPDIKSPAAEALGKNFPGASIIWRSSARATLAAAKQIEPSETCLIVEVGREATDLVCVRKGILERRVLVERGVRQLLGSLAKGKPPEETMTLMELFEKDQGDTDAMRGLREAIAKAEPELVHLFGEALAKLSSARKLSDQLMLIASPQIAPWFARFFARIDFTQFIAVALPFSVKSFSAADLSGVPQESPDLAADPTLCIACSLVNMERSS